MHQPRLFISLSTTKRLENLLNKTFLINFIKNINTFSLTDINLLGEHGPLTDALNTHLEQQAFELHKNVRWSEELNSGLLQENIISTEHSECINAKLTNTEKVRELLRIVKRRSICQYKSFYPCLKNLGFPITGNDN